MYTQLYHMYGIAFLTQTDVTENHFFQTHLRKI